jgi:dTDP-4-dehydrorhamnose reductase
VRETHYSDKRSLPGKRILVLGASGMLGHMLVRVLSKNHAVFGTTLSTYSETSPLIRILPRENWFDGINVCTIEAVERTINDVKPDVVLNGVGLIKQKMTPNVNSHAIHINSLFPHQLLELCKKVDTRLIHFSTDCVFEGTPGVKHVTDTPTATDMYGLSKLLGEVQEGPALTLRTSVVGRQLFGTESLFEWAISQQGKTVSGYKNAIYTGLTTLELSHVVKRIIEAQPDLVGLFQVASKPISKYELLAKLNVMLNLGLTIKPNTDFYCDRTLDGSEFSGLTNIEIPSWDNMLTKFSADQDFYENS